MNDAPRVVRPETLALDALIEAIIADAQNDKSASRTHSLLLLGRRQGGIPTQVVQDSVLEPVDKLVWMVMYLQAGKADACSGFPTYSDIGKQANISSRTTVSRTLAVLRLTRWLTLCSRDHNERKQFRGNVFVLHDEPLALADTLYLDTGYLQFLSKVQAHSHARVRTVARGVRDTLESDQQAGQGLHNDHPPTAQRVPAINGAKQVAAHTYFAFGANVMSRRHPFVNQQKGTEPVQNLNTLNPGVQNLGVQDLDNPCCSSVY